MVAYCDKNFIKKISSTFTVCLPGYIGRSKIKSKKMIKNFKKKIFFVRKNSGKTYIYMWKLLVMGIKLQIESKLKVFLVHYL